MVSDDLSKDRRQALEDLFFIPPKSKPQILPDIKLI